jgi:hypothetical protein
MIHELRVYTLKPGKLREYLGHAETIGRPARGQNYGVNIGYWTPEFSTLNQVWHIWAYESLDDRARLRAELGRNEAWTREYLPRIRPLLERQDISFMHPVKEVTAPPPGGIFELRAYRTEVGFVRTLADAYMEIMPVREKYSPNVGLWVGESPQPNEMLHMWAYPSLDARAKARAALFQDKEWLGHMAPVSPRIVEMKSTVLVPTAYSTMK